MKLSQCSNSLTTSKKYLTKNLKLYIILVGEKNGEKNAYKKGTYKRRVYGG